MSERVIQICDWCKSEKVKDEDYWATRHAEVEWYIPPDGINGGKFKGLLCATCRAILETTIRNVRTEREKAIPNGQ